MGRTSARDRSRARRRFPTLTGSVPNLGARLVVLQFLATMATLRSNRQKKKRPARGPPARGPLLTTQEGANMRGRCPARKGRSLMPSKLLALTDEQLTTVFNMAAPLASHSRR